jgi:hypothetical protein
MKFDRSNTNKSENHFFVSTLNITLKNELLAMWTDVPRKGLEIFNDGWKVTLKNDHILKTHIKKLDIRKIMLYNSIAPYVTKVDESAKVSFYVSREVVWDNGILIEDILGIGHDTYTEIQTPCTLHEGTILVCY